MRRRVFSQAAVATAALAVRSSSAVWPSERVRVGFIGTANRGGQLLDAFTVHQDCEVAALCDVYKPVLDKAKAKYNPQAETYEDFRQVLDRKDIDAVAIATPDHWHAL